MRHSKFGLRTFGVAIMAALSLLAFTAVVAQAETLTDGGKPGKFTVGGKTELAKPPAAFEAVQSGTGTLLVPGRGFDILCTGATASGEFKSETEALGSASFTGCTTWVNVAEGKTHTEKIPCTVAEPIKVEKARALPKKHESAPYIQLEEDGAAFTIVKLSGAECSLPATAEVTGSVNAQVDNNETVEPTLLFSQAIQKLMGSKLKYGAFEAFIDGTSVAKLTDAAHKGLKLGVI